VVTGYHYSFAKTRGKVLLPGFAIDLVGRAPEGVAFTFNNEVTTTYTVIDGHGVHVTVSDIIGGTCAINLQATTIADTLLRAVWDLMQTTGGDLKGSVTLTDIGGTGTVAMVTNAMMSGRPGIVYAQDQPLAQYPFTGNVRIIKTSLPPVTFGVANLVPPVL
jgi:hypothetical protein